MASVFDKSMYLCCGIGKDNIWRVSIYCLPYSERAAEDRKLILAQTLARGVHSTRFILQKKKKRTVFYTRQSEAHPSIHPSIHPSMHTHIHPYTHTPHACLTIGRKSVGGQRKRERLIAMSARMRYFSHPRMRYFPHPRVRYFPHPRMRYFPHPSIE